MSTPSELDNKAAAGAEGADAPEAGQVAEYLRAHPDFFDRQPGLLAELRIPHASGKAVSLIERQVQVLRDQNRQYKRKLIELVEIGRENDQLHASLYRLTMALMRASGPEAHLQALHTHLADDFRAEAIALRLVNPPAGAGDWIGPFGPEDRERDCLAGLFKTGRPLVGRLKPELLEYLFGERAGALGSAALIPLGEDARQGLLAIGKTDPDGYHPGMDVQFLTHLGELVACALAPDCGDGTGAA
ncbi:DUF484 family protein [Thiohalobacter sp.]|uniref:DUF484 family protein n=1 Tax=Thiohalobacter sp. TaxID=2025948 RepID=UPI00262967D8|nr:DUF484 family protein [Thiohalobacter sp.]